MTISAAILIVPVSCWKNLCKSDLGSFFFLVSFVKNFDAFLIVVWCLFLPSAIINKLACLSLLLLSSNLQALYKQFYCLMAHLLRFNGCSFQPYSFFLFLMETQVHSNLLVFIMLDQSNSLRMMANVFMLQSCNKSQSKALCIVNFCIYHCLLISYPYWQLSIRTASHQC